MKILITNDDGIQAEGIKNLAEVLKDEHEVVVAAPYQQQSGVSSHLTVSGDMQIKKNYMFDNVTAYSVQGTPADCVNIFLDKQEDFNFWPDIIISGINRGSNLCYDVIFSGTCGGARQGTIWGINSIALSSCDYVKPNYYTAALFIKNNLSLFTSIADKRSFWNVNVPSCELEEIKGYKYTKMGISIYDKNYSKTDENKYVLTGYGFEDPKLNEGADTMAVREKYVSITPLTIDQTNYELLEKFKK